MTQKPLPADSSEGKSEYVIGQVCRSDASNDCVARVPNGIVHLSVLDLSVSLRLVSAMLCHRHGALFDGEDVHKVLLQLVEV